MGRRPVANVATARVQHAPDLLLVLLIIGIIITITIVIVVQNFQEMVAPSQSAELLHNARVQQLLFQVVSGIDLPRDLIQDAFGPLEWFSMLLEASRYSFLEQLVNLILLRSRQVVPKQIVHGKGCHAASNVDTHCIRTNIVGAGKDCPNGYTFLCVSISMLKVIITMRKGLYCSNRVFQIAALIESHRRHCCCYAPPDAHRA